MKYLTADDAKRVRFPFDSVGSIHKSGSVKGMQERYGWPRGGQVRVGQYVYNVGPAKVREYQSQGILKG